MALLLASGAATMAPSVQAFNDDGFTDIVWQNETTREFAAWFLQRTNLIGSAWLNFNRDRDWRIAATADFNRDGSPDLLWRSPSTGDNEIWLMNGGSPTARQPITSSLAGFEIAGAGDFNGDGYADVLWRDPVRNLTVAWLMTGTNWSGKVGWITAASDFRWDLVITGDFNNDGFADIVWRDRFSGRNVLWLMNGTDLLQSVDLPSQPDLRFQLVASGQFNLLGQTDLLWRNVNGQNSAWLMRGTQYLATASLPAVTAPGWQIAGTGGYTNGMLLSALSDPTSQSLRLLWRYGSIKLPAIERRELGQTNWDLLATNYLPVRFTNFNIAVGKRYEYRVGGQYLLSGVAAAPVENRGTILLVVEQAVADQLDHDLEVLRTDLIGDGWSVVRTNVPRHQDQIWSQNVPAIASIKSFITNAYYRDPAGTKAVYLIGHVPIPYSGFPSPDGHGARALPADVYYGDVDGIYTDSSVNFTSLLGPPYFSRHDNLIGDGKFDQNIVPKNAQGIANVELAVGRADFSSLPSFGSLGEIGLTQRYLRKAHFYRHKQLVLPDRLRVISLLPFNPNREVYAQGVKIASRLFGNDPQSMVEKDPFNRDDSSLWGILATTGLPFAVFGSEGRYHQSADMVQTDFEPQVAFVNVYASFVHDFDYPDSFLRAFLGTPTYGLAAVWFRPVAVDRIPLAFEPLGMGEILGTGFVRSINESLRDPLLNANTYINFLGDPALRVQVLAPPGIIATNSDVTGVLKWNPSPESNASYLVYRSLNHLNGPWQRVTLNAISENQFKDNSAPFGLKLYQIRAAKLTTTGSGSFTNLSQAIYIEAP